MYIEVQHQKCEKYWLKRPERSVCGSGLIKGASGTLGSGVDAAECAQLCIDAGNGDCNNAIFNVGVCYNWAGTCELDANNNAYILVMNHNCKNDKNVFNTYKTGSSRTVISPSTYRSSINGAKDF